MGNYERPRPPELSTGSWLEETVGGVESFPEDTNAKTGIAPCAFITAAVIFSGIAFVNYVRGDVVGGIWATLPVPLAIKAALVTYRRNKARR